MPIKYEIKLLKKGSYGYNVVAEFSTYAACCEYINISIMQFHRYLKGTAKPSIMKNCKVEIAKSYYKTEKAIIIEKLCKRASPEIKTKDGIKTRLSHYKQETLSAVLNLLDTPEYANTQFENFKLFRKYAK